MHACLTSPISYFSYTQYFLYFAEYRLAAHTFQLCCVRWLPLQLPVPKFMMHVSLLSHKVVIRMM